MALSQPTAKRESLHRRTIEICGYRREDGLFDIEGHLLDRKDVDMKLASGQRKAGEPIHGMWLRITVDRTLTIVDAEAYTEHMPYLGACDVITPDYRKLVGLAIRPGYQQRVKELLGGVRGCTPHHGAGGLARHGGIPDLRRPGDFGSRAQALPTRSLPCARGHRARSGQVLSQVVPRHRTHRA